MFSSIRRHQSWIWLFVVVLVSLSMVVFFTADTPFGADGGGATGDFGTIDGKPVPVEEFRHAYREMQLGYLLRSGKMPGTDEATDSRLRQEALSRVFLIRKMKDLQIQPGEKAIGRVAQERIGDYPYEKLQNEFLAPAGLSAADFERFIRHEAAIQELATTAAVSAKYVNPREAEALFRKENEELLVDVALFSASNYLDKVAISNGVLGTFFTNRMAMYRVPDRVELSYVAFPVTNYFADADKQLSEITNLNARIDEAYLKAGTNFFTDGDGKAMSEAAAKQKIKDDERHRIALVSARRLAAEFGNDLISQSDPNKLENFPKLAGAKGYPILTSPAFDRFKGLEDTDFPLEFRTKGLALTDEGPIAFNPIVGSNAVYVVARKRRIPSEMPAYEKVAEKVTTDYKNTQAADLARRTGMAFHTNLTNGLLLKKPFAELAAADKVVTVTLPPFTTGTQTLTNIDPRINFQMVQRLASDLEPGKASPYLPSMDGGMILHLRQRVPVTDEKVKQELTTFIGNLRQYRQTEAFNRWFRKQAEIARVMAPRRETPPSQGGAPN